MNTPEQDFYTDGRLIKDFNKFKKYMLVVLNKRFSAAELEAILSDSEKRYNEIIPQIPYVGGYKNSGTTNLVGSAIVLAYIRTFEEKGLKEREIGEIIYEFFEVLFKEKSKFLKAVLRFLLPKKFIRNLLIKRFNKNKKYEHYEASWHSRIVEPEDDDFVFGLDVLQCGICKFYRDQKAEKYIKYLCLGDYPMINSMGFYLHRTKTLTTSGEVCNYRLRLDKEIERSWPPEKLIEWPKPQADKDD